MTYQFFKMKIHYLAIIAIVLLGCEANKSETNTNITASVNSNKLKFLHLEYIKTYYKKEDSKLQFVRIIRDSTVFCKVTGFLSNDNFHIVQRITDQDTIKASSLESIDKAIKENGFKDYISNNDEVLFVQLRIKSKDFLDVLDLRHDLEEKIDDALIEHNHSGWFAGDNWNMLFEVNDFAEGFKIILDVLQSSNLNNEFVIARRLHTAEDDWTYEIVYPINYEGKFYSG